MSATPIPFRKMNGLGNEFIVFDARRESVTLPTAAIRRLGESLGFDQMITIEKARNGADAFMRIHNRDGGEVDACGNATRCVGWLLMDETGRKQATIETNAGLLRAYDTGKAETITVDMGKPRFRWDEIPLAEEFRDTRAIELQIGPIDRADPRLALGRQHGQPARDLLGRRRRGLRSRPLRAAPREPPDVPRTGEHLARPCRPRATRSR